MQTEDKEALYGHLRERALENLRTIGQHLADDIDVPRVDLAEDLLASLRIMQQCGREMGRWK